MSRGVSLIPFSVSFLAAADVKRTFTGTTVAVCHVHIRTLRRSETSKDGARVSLEISIYFCICDLIVH